MAQDMSQDELHVYEKLYELMGARVKLMSDRTVYQGIIGTIIPGLRMVSLRHTSLINGEYLGVIRFRFREITRLKVVESSEVVNRYPKNEYLLNILKNKDNQKYNINDVLFDGQLSEPSDDEQSVDEESEEQEFSLELPPHLKNRLPNDSIVIDSMDINFTQAVQHISEQSVIGVSFDDPRLSRFGKLTILCISTTSHVYLFDIEKLQNEAFDKGLRSIFEETSIKKVIHDCRFPSDCLAHQYSTQLTNIFDTQVADFIVSMQSCNDKYEFKYVSSLDCCVRNHLYVPPEFLYQRVTGLSNVEKNNYFTKRPISNEFRHDLMKNALYLILLHKTLAKKLLDPLHKNVDVYLKVLATASEEEINSVGNELSPPDSIPLPILMNGIQTARFQKPEKKSLISLECKFMDPKTGHIIEPEKILHSEGTPLKRHLNSKNVNKKTDEVNKENWILQRKSEHRKYDPDTTYAESIQSPLETRSVIVESITVDPSIRLLDEVYHKLVNNIGLRSHYSQSEIIAKPTANYVSVFTVKKPFSNCGTNIDISKDLRADNDVDSISENSCNTKNVSSIMQNSSLSGDFWASLSASSDVSSISSQSLKEKYKNIKFVPA